MVGSKLPQVSAVVVTYNSQSYIEECLENITVTDYPNLEIIVVDNASTDHTCKIVSKNFPNVKLIKSDNNLGYAGGNNLGVSVAGGDIITVINPDTKVTGNWLKPLVSGLSLKKAAVCQPKIMLSNQTGKINLTGKTTHFLGFEWLTDYLRQDYKMEDREITSFSGSCFLIRKSVFLKFGGFDESFFMYYEDGDLSWRLRLAGYKIYLIPKSVVGHDYKFEPNENYQKARKKFYQLERNRLLMIMKNYSLKTLVLCFPAIVLIEICMIFYFCLKGWYLEKWKSYGWIISHIDSIIAKRKTIQDNRRVSDKEIVVPFVGKIEFVELDNLLLRIFINPFLNLYWFLVKLVI